MPEANQDATSSVEACGSQQSNNIFPSQTRRRFLGMAIATGACAAAHSAAVADDDKPGSDERPQQADLLVFSEGDRASEVIQPHDLNFGGPPVLAWPKDPHTGVVRDGSRLNQVLVVKLDPAELDDDTRARAADGIVAYSAICSHAGCPVTAWVKGAAGDKDVFKCVCHNSEYDPRQGAQVVFGPAPRRLAPLPLQSIGDSLTVAATFVGKVGQQAG
jgi:rieske iron-sulfur protein